MVTKCLISPLKHYLAENISLQIKDLIAINCSLRIQPPLIRSRYYVRNAKSVGYNIFGIKDTVALYANEARFFRFRVIF